MRNVKYPITIYYDASCPICATEMHALKSRDDSNRLAIVDCSDPAFDNRPMASPRVSQKALMRIIHARDANGEWMRGVDVFVAAYEAAGFRIAPALLRIRILRPLWDRIYPWVAANRYLLSAMGLQRAFRWIVPRGPADGCKRARCAGRGLT